MSFVLGSEVAAPNGVGRRRSPHGLPARLLVGTIQILYGDDPSLGRLNALERVATAPEQARERLACVLAPLTSGSPRLGRRVAALLRESREERASGERRLSILYDFIRRRPGPESLLGHWLLPRLLALACRQLSWLLCLIHPSLSYRLSAELRDRAEGDYLRRASLDRRERDPASAPDLFERFALESRAQKRRSLARTRGPLEAGAAAPS